jgi:phospholipid-binding lipoprotein MlaA
MKKFLITSLLSFMLVTNVSADTDGENNLSKKNSGEVKDCFEGLNRATFSLNQGLDKVIFKPVAKGYRKLPSPIRSGTSNALENISSLITIPNNILQGEFKKAGINTGRFAVNTTVGILGIFDIATKMNLPEYEKEDYGQTFGAWGIGAGCYVVLPIIGPSTVRDAFGSFVNVLGGDPYYNASVHGNNQYLDKDIYMTTKIISGIDFRAKNIESIDNLEKNSMDFYASVRSLYLQDRQQKIRNSDPTIDIMYEGDWEEVETQ